VRWRSSALADSGFRSRSGEASAARSTWALKMVSHAADAAGLTSAMGDIGMGDIGMGGIRADLTACPAVHRYNSADWPGPLLKDTALPCSTGPPSLRQRSSPAWAETRARGLVALSRDRAWPGLPGGRPSRDGGDLRARPVTCRTCGAHRMFTAKRRMTQKSCSVWLRTASHTGQIHKGSKAVVLPVSGCAGGSGLTGSSISFSPDSMPVVYAVHGDAIQRHGGVPAQQTLYRGACATGCRIVGFRRTMLSGGSCAADGDGSSAADWDKPFSGTARARDCIGLYFVNAKVIDPC
jgi:hypothetical protein